MLSEIYRGPTICQFVSVTPAGVSRSPSPIRTIPFISQIERLPFAWFCQTRSTRPSLLMCVTARIFQFVSLTWPGDNRTPLIRTVPFMNHAEIKPLVWCCQTRSV